MSENYDVYRRRERGRRTTHSSNQGTYIKKISRQILASIICLGAVYLFETSNSSLGNSVNNSIKAALNYKVDTSSIQVGITSMLDKLVEKK